MKKNIQSEPMYLGKYISTSGYCSRRKAIELVKAGKVHVNNKPQTDPAYPVKLKDTVMVNGRLIEQAQKVYILYNKPKDVICTLQDPEGRTTIAEIFAGEFQERLFPIGRLDRATTGLIIMTNDGDLAQKLSHPSYEIPKMYQITTEQTLKPYDVKQLVEGIELEDGRMFVDEISFPTIKRTISQVVIHSGKNRIIRRMYEALNHTIKKLDRIMFAGLTKQKLALGAWRKLEQHEVQELLAIKPVKKYSKTKFDDFDEDTPTQKKAVKNIKKTPRKKVASSVPKGFPQYADVAEDSKIPGYQSKTGKVHTGGRRAQQRASLKRQEQQADQEDGQRTSSRTSSGTRSFTKSSGSSYHRKPAYSKPKAPDRYQEQDFDDYNDHNDTAPQKGSRRRSSTGFDSRPAQERPTRKTSRTTREEKPARKNESFKSRTNSKAPKRSGRPVSSARRTENNRWKKKKSE